MRRSDLLMKIASAVALLAVVFYIGYYLYDSRVNSLRTVLAVPASSEESVYAEGYAVREETVINGGSGVYVTASDGDKVASGGQLAVRYLSREAASRSEQMKAVQLRLNALTALSGTKTSSDAVKSSVLDLAHAVRGGGLSDIDTVGTNVETYIFGDEASYTDEQLASEISQLKAQLSAFEAAASGDTERITAPESGVFSSRADGFESVSPDDLKELTSARYAELFEKADRVPATAAGKIVTGLKWYFVTELPSSSAIRLDEGDTATLRFTKTYSEKLDMRVEHVGNNENGNRVVVFSSGKYMQDVASVRDMYAEIIFSSVSGVRVPREAMHVDENGQTFVYVLVGVQAVRADADILSEGGDYYIVNPVEGSKLFAGADIVVSAGELYDGKVIS